MTPKDFIFTKLKLFILDFPSTRVRYEHDITSDTHFVEVVPNEIYHDDADYIRWESEMFDEFVALFPCENICFISDDALVGIEKIDFEAEGLLFNTLCFTISENIFVETVKLEVLETVNTEKYFNPITYSDTKEYMDNADSGIYADLQQIEVLPIAS